MINSDWGEEGASVVRLNCILVVAVRASGFNEGLHLQPVASVFSDRLKTRQMRQNTNKENCLLLC